MKNKLFLLVPVGDEIQLRKWKEISKLKKHVTVYCILLRNGICFAGYFVKFMKYSREFMMNYGCSINNITTLES